MLQVAKLPDVPPIPWSLLKNLKKEERKKKRQSLLNDLKTNIDSKMKERTKFLLGINAVARGINKNAVSLIIIADDVEPKQLIHHLFFLSNKKNIPCVTFTKLRTVTMDALGFPCIALGFKKGFDEFQKIRETICEMCKFEDLACENDSTIYECTVSTPGCKVAELSEEKPVYQYRQSKSERCFVPRGSNNKNSVDYIALMEVAASEINNECLLKGISSNVIKEVKKKRKRKMLKTTNDSLMEESDEIPEIKVKKPKEWIIDKQGMRKFKSTQMHEEEYSRAKIMKVQSNPDRVSKIRGKKKNVRKKRE